MATPPPYRIRSLTDYHQLIGLPRPQHPLLSLVNIEEIKRPPIDGSISVVFDFYIISLKRLHDVRLKYGQQVGDFESGVLFFMAPGQVLGIEFDPVASKASSGWMLLIHPDFLWHTALATRIGQYGYFQYSVNEALYLSDNEEVTISQLIANIRQEYQANIDKFSHGIIITQLEALLAYAERFYERQFLTRRVASHQLLDRLEAILTSYFASDALSRHGLPSVSSVADQLHVSPDYLSALLRTLTGLTTQQHIHEKLIEKAKQQLSTTGLSVSEIAYALGFEHPQSFSKFFKSKTHCSPGAFRASFN